MAEEPFTDIKTMAAHTFSKYKPFSLKARMLWGGSASAAS
jgi:hypothetical protein